MSDELIELLFAEAEEKMEKSSPELKVNSLQLEPDALVLR